MTTRSNGPIGHSNNLRSVLFVRALVTCAIMLPVMGACAHRTAEKQPLLTGDEVLSRVMERYATAERYDDRASVSIWFHPKDASRESWPQRYTFETSFVRGASFSFHCWTDRGPFPMQEFVEAKDGRVQMRSGWKSEQRSAETVGFALGSIAGVTYGSSTLITPLLMPRAVEGSSVLDTVNLTVLPRPDDRATINLAGTGTSGSAMRIMVNPDTYAICAIEEKRDTASVTTVSRTVFEHVRFE